MAYDFLNTTTYSNDDLAQGDGVVNQIASAAQAQQASPYDIPEVEPDDLVEIDDAESVSPELEEVDDQTADATSSDTHDFENDALSENDMQIMSYLFSDPTPRDPQSSMRDADTVFASDTNGNRLDLNILKRKSDNVNLDGINPTLSKYLIDMPQDIRDSLVVTSGNDQEHAPNSRHYSGNAVDLRYNQRAYDFIMNDPVAQRLGINMLDPNHGTAKHIHLQTKQAGGTIGSRPTFKDIIRNNTQYFTGINTLDKSKFTPSNAKDSNATYYTYPDAKQQVLNNLSSGPHKLNFDSFESLWSQLKGGQSRYMSSAGLGHYKVDSGEDDKGQKYVSLYDTFNWDLLPGNSYEVYDRIYQNDYNNISQKKQSGGNANFNTGNRTLIAENPGALMKGLNNQNYNKAVLKLNGVNTIRGLDNGQPVAVTDGSKYKILKGPNDMANFKGNVYEQRL